MVDFSKIKLLVMDFDGVLTDNSVIFDQNGKESVVCNRSDSLGLDMLREKRIPAFIISKEKNPVVTARAEKIKVGVWQDVDDKITLFKAEVRKRGVPMEQVCFMGNDVNDILCIKEAGIGVAVADSHPLVLKHADYVTKANGGKGAVREVCDLIAFSP